MISAMPTSWAAVILKVCRYLPDSISIAKFGHHDNQGILQKLRQPLQWFPFGSPQKNSIHIKSL